MLACKDARRLGVSQRRSLRFRIEPLGEFLSHRDLPTHYPWKLRTTRQAWHEIAEKSSKIVPLGAPLNPWRSISWRSHLCCRAISFLIFGNTWEQLLVEQAARFSFRNHSSVCIDFESRRHMLSLEVITYWVLGRKNATRFLRQTIHHFSPLTMLGGPSNAVQRRLSRTAPRVTLADLSKFSANN